MDLCPALFVQPTNRFLKEPPILRLICEMRIRVFCYCFFKSHDAVCIFNKLFSARYITGVEKKLAIYKHNEPIRGNRKPA